MGLGNRCQPDPCEPHLESELVVSTRTRFSSLSPQSIIVHIPLFHTVFQPFLFATGTAIGLHLLARIFFLSYRQRTRRLFAHSRWLPLRFPSMPLKGEEVEFQSHDRTILRGVLLSHRGPLRKGSVLFCHELNGTHLSVTPYVDSLVEAGFDILTFDYRNHGKSDFTYKNQPTPWVTSTDMADVRAAIDFLVSRTHNSSADDAQAGVGIFGFGKGAAIALCAAGSDERVHSVVLDAPMPESALFDINCREILTKSLRLSQRRSSRFLTFCARAVLYSLACPFLSLMYAWRRFVFGVWFGCRFVDPRAFAKKVQQPVMVVHSHTESAARADQIQAFCHRMTKRPRFWSVSEKERLSSGGVPDSCSQQVARFFKESASDATALKPELGSA